MSDIPFISWLGHGAADLSPPGMFTDARANAFIFEADKAAMQKTVDTLLNPAGGGVVRYEVPLPIGMVSFMDIAKSTSGTDQVGWLPARETAFWIPLVETHPGNPFKDRFVMWTPYIFINYAIGMVIGREIWGWPKVLADISVASDTPKAPQFGCATTYFPTLSAATQGVTGPLYRVLPNTPSVEHESIWASGEEALEAIIGKTLGGLARTLLSAFDIEPRAPSVALKQFRDPASPQKAIYQAICDSPIQINQFNGGGILEGDWQVEITTCESHQIVQDFFGRAPDPGKTLLPVKLAVWADIDFEALNGDTIVANGQAV